MNKNIQAIIWDYDGTLVDSRRKNLNVTRRIIENVSGKSWNNFYVLKSSEEYHLAHSKATNWREFYEIEFNWNDKQIDEAGRLWTEFQLEDQTPLPFIDGVEKVIKAMSEIPQGIVSQNSRENIIKKLKEKKLLSHFRNIVGYEEVSMENQKPDPAGLLMCIEGLAEHKSGYVFYIGDHETDVRCALNANDVLGKDKKDIKILSIGAFYGFDVDTSGWDFLPDFTTQSAGDIINIISNFQKGANTYIAGR